MKDIKPICDGVAFGGVIVIFILIATGTIALGYEESFEDVPYETVEDNAFEDTFDECWNCPQKPPTEEEDDDSDLQQRRNVKEKNVEKVKVKTKINQIIQTKVKERVGINKSMMY